MKATLLCGMLVLLPVAAATYYPNIAGAGIAFQTSHDEWQDVASIAADQVMCTPTAERVTAELTIQDGAPTDRLLLTFWQGSAASKSANATLGHPARIIDWVGCGGATLFVDGSSVVSRAVYSFTVLEE